MNTVKRTAEIGEKILITNTRRLHPSRKGAIYTIESRLGNCVNVLEIPWAVLDSEYEVIEESANESAKAYMVEVYYGMEHYQNEKRTFNLHQKAEALAYYNGWMEKNPLRISFYELVRLHTNTG